jgi:hypothetical protein
MMRFEEELNQAGVDPESFAARLHVESVRAIVRRSILFLLMLGPAVLGTITTIRLQTRRSSGDQILARLRRRDLDDQDHLRDAVVSTYLDRLTVLGYVSFGWLVACSRSW